MITRQLGFMLLATTAAVYSNGNPAKRPIRYSVRVNPRNPDAERNYETIHEDQTNPPVFFSSSSPYLEIPNVQPNPQFATGFSNNNNDNNSIQPQLNLIPPLSQSRPGNYIRYTLTPTLTETPKSLDYLQYSKNNYVAGKNTKSFNVPSNYKTKNFNVKINADTHTVTSTAYSDLTPPPIEQNYVRPYELLPQQLNMNFSKANVPYNYTEQSNQENFGNVQQPDYHGDIKIEKPTTFENNFEQGNGNYQHLNIGTSQHSNLFEATSYFGGSPPAPFVQTHQKETRANPHYSFHYAVQDQHSGDVKEHKEERVGEDVQGYYSLLQPDGRVRTVTYKAGGNYGFHANVSNSGQ